MTLIEHFFHSPTDEVGYFRILFVLVDGSLCVTVGGDSGGTGITGRCESVDDGFIKPITEKPSEMLLHDGGGKMRLGQRRRQQLPQILKFLACNEVMLVPPE